MKTHQTVRGAATSGGRMWLLGATVTVAAALAIYWGMTQSAVDTGHGTEHQPEASSTPLDRTTGSPAARGEVPVPGEPEPPPDVEKIRAEAFVEAVERGDAHPAHTAFRKVSDAFVEYNRQLADAQAQKEGVTLDEIKELTYFGLMVQQTLRWPGVESVLGQPVEKAQRVAAEQMMHELNAEFKASIRALVKSGGTQEERQRLIDDVQRRYREGYFATTGMTEELLEDLLAGDLGRKYPMSQLPPPQRLAERAPIDDPTHVREALEAENDEEDQVDEDAPNHEEAPA
ncbi:MAG: hypothetical protein AAF449_12355, partial [Myxococcota bacterium]